MNWMCAACQKNQENVYLWKCRLLCLDCLPLREMSLGMQTRFLRLRCQRTRQQVELLRQANARHIGHAPLSQP